MMDVPGAKVSERTHALFNRAVGLYELALSKRVEPVVQALASGAGLLAALEPFMTNDSGCHLDDADIVFSAACGLSNDVIGQGVGRCYCPTPLRRLVHAVWSMALDSTDVVLDIGGGPGLTALAGAGVSSATFVNIEIDHEMAAFSRALHDWSGYRERARTINADLLSGCFPRAAKAYVFEPVLADDAAVLVERLAEAGIAQVCCYAPFESVRDVRDSLERSERYELAGSAEDMLIFNLRST
jgi:hypothetical protein